MNQYCYSVLSLLYLCSYVLANYKRVCYFTNWAQYRQGAGKYFAKDLDPFLCTHVIYAFAKVSGNSIEPYEWNDINEWGKGGYEMARDLKIANPTLQLLLAIGGWNHGSAPFTAIVSTQSNIDQFANNTITFLRANGFDGLDLDWEYPANRGSPPEDKQRFTSLVQTLRAKFDNDVLKTGRSPLLLTAAVSAGKSTIDTAYEIDKISIYLDFINLMAYDFNGGTSQTGHNSPLYNSGPPNPDFNTDFAVNLWLNGGAPKHKLILGLATYGRSYTLQSTTNTGLGAPASGPGTAGTFTGESGFLAYYEICSFIANNGWTEVWLDDQQVPYAYKGNQWVGYDNLRSIGVKANYIITKGLGGAMIWAVDLDDFHGNCGQGNNPLMNKMRSVFNGTSGPDISVTTRSPVVSSPTIPVSSGITSYVSKNVIKNSISEDPQLLPPTASSPANEHLDNVPITAALQTDCGCSVDTIGGVLGALLTIAIVTIVLLVIYILRLKGYKLLPCFAKSNPEKHKPTVNNQVTYTDVAKPLPDESTGGFTSHDKYDNSRFRENIKASNEKYGFPNEKPPLPMDKPRLPLGYREPVHNININRSNAAPIEPSIIRLYENPSHEGDFEFVNPRSRGHNNISPPIRPPQPSYPIVHKGLGSSTVV